MAVTNGGPRQANGESSRPFPTALVVALRPIVFARFAEPGKVKTRLNGRLGAAGASDLHRKLTAHTLASVLGAFRNLRRGPVRRGERTGDAVLLRRGRLVPPANVRGTSAHEWPARSETPWTRGASAGRPDRLELRGDPVRAPGSGVRLSGRGSWAHRAGAGPRRGVLSRRDEPEASAVVPRDRVGTEHVFRRTEAAARESGYPLQTLGPVADVGRPEDLDVWYAVRDRASAVGRRARSSSSSTRTPSSPTVTIRRSPGRSTGPARSPAHSASRSGVARGRFASSSPWSTGDRPPWGCLPATRRCS